MLYFNLSQADKILTIYKKHSITNLPTLIVKHLTLIYVKTGEIHSECFDTTIYKQNYFNGYIKLVYFLPISDKSFA
jgi:hypothetical protein